MAKPAIALSSVTAAVFIGALVMSDHVVAQEKFADSRAIELQRAPAVASAFRHMAARASRAPGCELR
jgi:hypothetical protein